MCKVQCFLVFTALVIKLVNCWDIAITAGDQIEFYSNTTRTSDEGVRFRDLTALAYDAVHNMLLFVDKQTDNASIFSYNLLTKKHQPLVGRRSYENIQGLAFDPVTRKMFWTDANEKSIYWISLDPSLNNNIYGNLLIRMDDEIPRGIDVDSCRGYIYWTNTNIKRATIERARFDGSERTIIVDSDIHMPVSIAVDQHTKRLYWADDKEGIHYSIESSNLEGKDRRTLLEGTYHQPNSITVSKDSIYWVDWGYKSVWKLPKNAALNEHPEELINFSGKYPFGIVANYPLADQTNGVPECSDLAKLSQSNAIINETITIPKDVGLYCVHGELTDTKSCKCSVGYIGSRCDISVCQNFCLHGDCSASIEGKPTCKCSAGYSGERCDVDVCLNYCLNDGQCSINDQNEPVCKCYRYRGKRCEQKAAEVVSVTTNTCNCTTEELKELPKTDSKKVLSKDNESKDLPSVTDKKELSGSNESKEASAPNEKQISAINDRKELSSLNGSVDEVFVDSNECNDGWDPVRDPVLMLLGVLCGLLCLACAVLITKILHLRRRPRIKKRIIVNKNVTPLTARPDQCEITIENCCNMNICETPCFEPRNTIRPKLLEGKQGKEEKKNLIANMENSDDIY